MSERRLSQKPLTVEDVEKGGVSSYLATYPRKEPLFSTSSTVKGSLRQTFFTHFAGSRSCR